MCCSSAQHTCGAVGARIEDDGWLFEYTSDDSTWTFSSSYGPSACIAAICAKKPPSPQYAPLSSTSRALRATSVPSARAPVSSSITMPSRR